VNHGYQCRNLSIRAGRKTLLEGIDLTLAPGELAIIVGPNGAGKSTLMKALSGDHPPAGGTVDYDGVPLDRWSPGQLAERRAVMPQSSALSFPFTVLEVVRLAARLFAPDERQATLRAEAALERVDLAGYGGRFYQELSGGEQQRVQLARTLCQVWEPVKDGIPKFLFLDEPTASLDIRHQLDILSLAREFCRRGGGCIAILHDLNIAAMFADRLIALHQGRKVAEGAPADVLTTDFMRDVFGVDLAVGQAPSHEPFVLPQAVCI